MLSGCASMIVQSVVDPAVDNMQRQTDIELVCDGAPALLLMLDSLLADDPQNSRLLVTAVQAYGAYAAALTSCGKEQRAVELTDKSKSYGLVLLARLHLFSDKDYSLAGMELPLQAVIADDVPSLFWGGYGWAVWLQYQQGSPAALADLLKVEKIMKRVVELNEQYFYGSAHLFLGAYYGARPQMLGGNPDLGLKHFERALVISGGQFLAIQVTFAETYAKTVFDRDLYEKMLQEVIDFPLDKRPDLMLANHIAKRKAITLLQEIDEYF